MSFERAVRTRDPRQARLARAREVGHADGIAGRPKFGGYFLEPSDKDERSSYLAAYRRGEDRREELR